MLFEVDLKKRTKGIYWNLKNKRKEEKRVNQGSASQKKRKKLKILKLREEIDLHRK